MIALDVWGKYAWFFDPITRKNYSFITPSAAKGILESIYWHPGIDYIIDEIKVLSPIRFEKILLKPTAEQCVGWMHDDNLVQARQIEVLVNVHYVIVAHYRLTKDQRPTMTPGKVMAIFKRRAMKGLAYRIPCFGNRAFPAEYSWLEKESIQQKNGIKVTRDFGIMLYELNRCDYKNIRPTWFHAKLQEGILDLRNIKVIENGQTIIKNIQKTNAV